MSTPLPTVEVTGEYLMDPDTEDLLWGDQLAEGMVVLIEEALMRHNLESRRWCRVTQMRPGFGEDSLTRFVGVYGDGSKFSRRYHKSYAWFVKLDSLPEVAR